MNLLKYTPYLYLIFAGFFIYDGITKIYEADRTYILSFLFAGLGIFMFFFRRNFANKFEARNRKP